jgi:hypothetical protein
MSSCKRAELASPYRVLSSESGMYYLLIEGVSTVTIEFLQYRAQVRIRLNRVGIERVIERTGLFISLNEILRSFVKKKKSFYSFWNFF